MHVYLRRNTVSILHVVGLSGGKDSTALALYLKENTTCNYIYLCTPTGDELPEMENHWGHLECLLSSPLFLRVRQ